MQIALFLPIQAKRQFTPAKKKIKTHRKPRKANISNAQNSKCPKYPKKRSSNWRTKGNNKCGITPKNSLESPRKRFETDAYTTYFTGKTF